MLPVLVRLGDFSFTVLHVCLLLLDEKTQKSKLLVGYSRTLCLLNLKI
jgi:hypothetical protein